MEIKQSVINSFQRVGIDYKKDLEFAEFVEQSGGGLKTIATNRFSGETVETHPLVAHCIKWVYDTSNAYERGDYSVKIADFDRIRYFVLAQDSNAYNVCLD